MSEWAARRFWEAVSVREVEAGFAVYLDERPLRTPAKAELLAPTEIMADRIAERIEKADENGDGLLQMEEIQAQMDGRRGPSPERMFNRFDANEDGTLSAEEFAEAQDRAGRRGPRGDRDDN